MTKIINAYAPGWPSVGGVKALPMAVLTEDAAGFQAVYVAIVPDFGTYDEKMKIADLVAVSGHKIGYNAALAWFPHLEKKNYRA